MQKRERYQAQEFLVEGVRLCQELLDSTLSISALIFTDTLLDNPHQNLLSEAEKKQIPVWHTDEKNLAHLTDTNHPQPIVACAKMRNHEIATAFFEKRRMLILLNISDPGNVGTLLRTAEAFGWDGVVCAGHTADIYNPKILRSAMGSAFRLPIVYAAEEQLLSFLEDTGVFSVVSTPHQGMTPPVSYLPEKLALILGNEAHGIPAHWTAKSHLQIQLPMTENVESLNVAVAGGVLLFLLR